VLCAELKAAPPVARPKALAAVARALREPPGIFRDFAGAGILHRETRVCLAKE